MSIINKFFIKILKFYKKYISGCLKSGCIFTPTCSEYAMEAFEKRNFLVSFVLIIRRILRCNTINKIFNKGGFDPVPDSKRKKIWLL